MLPHTNCNYVDCVRSISAEIVNKYLAVDIKCFLLCQSRWKKFINMDCRRRRRRCGRDLSRGVVLVVVVRQVSRLSSRFKRGASPATSYGEEPGKVGVGD
ncbi:hypothetical protein M758_4G033000 [Ceratodon purpureus]|nr:hypothetical protein M758_4G033000 [Ceratodon purpureus]